jgi:peptide/nickel transport system permease protein
MKINYWRYFKRDKAAVVGLFILLTILLMALFGPFLVQVDPNQQILQLSHAPISIHNIFGRDQLGRDIFARIVFGARYTLLSGIAATTIGFGVGFLMGVLSGYYGGFVDEVFMRLVDLMLSFPFFLLAILIIAILGPGLVNAVLAVGIANIPIFARFARGVTLQIRGLPYIDSARALGSSNRWIIFRHILPNIVVPTFILAAVETADTILAISGLSFLGLGAQPPIPEWGLMLSEAKGYLAQAPLIMIFPGVFIFLLVLSINLVSDGIQYALNPRRH